MIRACSIALAAVLIAAVVPIGLGAQAQEAIPTAAKALSAGAPSPAPTEPPLRLGARNERDDGGPPLVGPCGAIGKVHDGVAEKPDKKPHGEVWAGVGTAGYREAGGVVCQPLGDNASVTIAVDAARIGR